MNRYEKFSKVSYKSVKVFFKLLSVALTMDRQTTLYHNMSCLSWAYKNEMLLTETGERFRFFRASSFNLLDTCVFKDSTLYMPWLFLLKKPFFPNSMELFYLIFLPTYFYQHFLQSKNAIDTKQNLNTSTHAFFVETR